MTVLAAAVEDAPAGVPGHLPVCKHPDRYHGHRVALLTQHRKELIVAPVLAAAVGCQVERVAGYDTEQLGTFTRDIPRARNQLETARRKARIGMHLSGLPIGLASEGAFGPDPLTGMLPWNVEILIWIDDLHGWEIVGGAQGAAFFSHLLTDCWTEAEAFARKWGFPEHHLVVRPAGADDLRIRKGVARWAEFESAFHAAQAADESRKVFLESDVRAHSNPTRQIVIRQAADDLAARLRSLCPACAAPGFSVVRRIPGLPCSACHAPTRETLAEQLGCVKCSHQVTRPRIGSDAATPARCDYCNP